MKKTDAARALAALDTTPTTNWRQRRAKRQAADHLRRAVYKPRARRETAAESEAIPF
jgi:hypothetical protein